MIRADYEQSLFSFCSSQENGMAASKVENFHDDKEIKTYVEMVETTGLKELDIDEHTDRLLVGFEGTTD